MAINTFETIPRHRLFLPSAVVLQANASEDIVRLLSDYGDERAHAPRVRDLDLPRRADRSAPFLWIDADEAEIVVEDAERDLFPQLLEHGFERSSWRDAHTAYLDEDKVLDVLAWAASVGIVLHHEAREELKSAGRADAVWRLAWEPGAVAFGDEESGPWADRLRDEARVHSLRKALSYAIRSSSEQAVHLTPTPCGELFQRTENACGGQGTEAGCGALVLRREDFRLRVYLPQEDWLSWALQRVLLDAWAEETFGEGTPWHWG